MAASQEQPLAFIPRWGSIMHGLKYCCFKTFPLQDQNKNKRPPFGKPQIILKP